MEASDLKLLAFNSATLLISFAAVENMLKFVLLIASIIYTVQRIQELYKKRKES
mgnify:FL=1